MDQRTIQIRFTAKQQESISRHVSASAAILVLDDEEIDLGDVDLTYLPDGPG